MSYQDPTDGPREESPQARRNKYLTIGHMRRVFAEVVAQVEGGKGAERHGKGQFLDQQQWVILARHHGVGFLTGQAAKKLNETPGLTTKEARQRELLGAMAYAAFAYMMEDLEDETCEEAPGETGPGPLRFKDHAHRLDLYS